MTTAGMVEYGASFTLFAEAPLSSGQVQRVIKRGLRAQFDRVDRRDLSVLRLGRRFLDA